jgi:hypothetical protein
MSDITYQQLVALGACADQLEKFRELFGDSTDIKPELAEYASTFDWDWIARKTLPASAQAEFERVRSAAQAEYERVIAPEWAEFERVWAGTFLRLHMEQRTVSTITYQQLADMGACADQLEKFRELFGDSTDIKPELIEYASAFDWDWIARKTLPAPARAEFMRVRNAAWAKFERERDAAWAEFERVCAEAFLRLHTEYCSGNTHLGANHVVR